MVQIQFFYRKDTLQIDAVFVSCVTESTVWKNTAVYVEVNIVDPPYAVSRDHKVILDAYGNVIGTTPSPNPYQPQPIIGTPTHVTTIPPTGKKKVTSIYWDPGTGELVFDHEA